RSASASASADPMNPATPVIRYFAIPPPQNRTYPYHTNQVRLASRDHLLEWHVLGVRACYRRQRPYLGFLPELDVPRVSAMISSVLMRGSAVPRSASMARCPRRPAPGSGLA